MRRDCVIVILLAGITLGLYWPVGGFDLIRFDDPTVMQDTPEVQAGLTWAGLKWALTSVVIANWHPLTNLSYLLVAQFFGHTPGAQHLANAALHAANAGLLFLLLRCLTGATWRSAATAAIFAWHPQRVESVAWIIERKDVLCAFFFLLALLAYARWNQPGGDRRSKLFPGLSLLAFAAALLSKPMAITLPFALLLVDVWPLRRISFNPWRAADVLPLLREKILFFALMLLFGAGTYWIQHDYAAMTPWEKLGLVPRVANAINSYVGYPAQLFWPAGLAAIYPFPKSFDPLRICVNAALLLGITAACLAQLKRRPQLAFGWFWYLGLALPVIGIIQVGEQAMADRYTYLPLIGPVAALVWTVAEIRQTVPGAKIWLATGTPILLSGLLVLSHRQLLFWRNTIDLFTHNVAVTPDNGAAYYTLGIGYETAGDTNRAFACYQEAKKDSPDDLQIRRNLASLLAQTGQVAAAEAECRELLARQPDDAASRALLSALYAGEGRSKEAIAELDAGLQLSPDSFELMNNLAWLLATCAQPELRDGPRAVPLAQSACERTHFGRTLYIGTLAAAYAEAGKFDEAIATAQKACDRAEQNGETALLKRNQELLELYRQHQAYHE